MEFAPDPLQPFPQTVHAEQSGKGILHNVSGYPKAGFINDPQSIKLIKLQLLNHI